MNTYRIRAKLIRTGEIYNTWINSSRETTAADNTWINIVWETTAADLAAATEKAAFYIRMAERDERAECTVMTVEVI